MYDIRVDVDNVANDGTRTGGCVLVTGASSGIGAAAAAEVAARGLVVGCLSRRGDIPAGPRLLSFRADVQDEDAVADALARLVEAAGPLRGVVNSAGRHLERSSMEVTTAEARALMDLNFLATFAVCRLAYPHLRAAGGGTIVNIGSFYDRLGVPRNAVYASSKAAIAGLTRCLAVEWAGDAIRVLDVAPGYVRTALNEDFFADADRLAKVARRIPVRRVGEPAEIGRFVAGLITDPIAFLTGETIYLDGAQNIAL
jgi:NAD(P)-dependent dehydrogenase (short-subunit alcohol dehydrogenase family)